MTDPAAGLLANDPRVRGIVMTVHDAAVAAGQEGYVDPVTGLFVMTEATLAARRSCCDTGCRHCPYRPIDGGP